MSRVLATKLRRIPCARAHGFSLLEVIVAFAIMAMALGALYQASGGSSRAGLHAETTARMVVLARSKLAEHPTVPPHGLHAAGESADGLVWQLRSQPFAHGSEGIQPVAVRLHRVHVRVEAPRPERPQVLDLYTLVPVLGEG